MAHVGILTPACYRQDLTKTAIVFGSLLVAAAALCGTLDMARPVAPIDEVQALNDEHAIGPAGIDPYAFDCSDRKNDSGHFHLASNSPNCRNAKKKVVNSVH
jgi:hypothetical protein